MRASDVTCTVHDRPERSHLPALSDLLGADLLLSAPSAEREERTRAALAVLVEAIVANLGGLS